MRMGSPEEASVEPGETGYFKFIIDEHSDVEVIQRNSMGSTKTYVSLNWDIDEKNVASFSQSGSTTLYIEEEGYQAAVPYYIIVQNTGAETAKFTLLLT